MQRSTIAPFLVIHSTGVVAEGKAVVWLDRQGQQQHLSYSELRQQSHSVPPILKSNCVFK